MAQDPAIQAPPADLRPARLEARIVAGGVDALILFALLPPFVALAGLTVLAQTDWLAQDPSGTEWMWGYLVGGLWLLTPPLYFTLGAMRGDTTGARLLGLTIRGDGRSRPALGSALLRALLTMLGFLLLGIGFMGSAFDSRRRTLGDRLSGTEVLEAVVES